MPGPIAHAAAGYLIYRVFRPIIPAAADHKLGPMPVLLASSLALSLSPDLDAVPGLLLGDLGRFHNNLTHSLAAGLVVALATGLVMRALGRPDALKWGLLALVCFQIHLLMDLVTYDTRGLMLWWPFSHERIQGPAPFFYGLRWSQGLVTAKHLITIGSETALAVAVILLVKLVDCRKRGGPTLESTAPPR